MTLTLVDEKANLEEKKRQYLALRLKVATEILGALVANREPRSTDREDVVWTALIYADGLIVANNNRAVHDYMIEVMGALGGDQA